MPPFWQAAHKRDDPLSTNSILATLIQTIGETFDADTSGLSETSVADDVDGWDSISHAMLVMNLEEKLGIELDIEQSMSAPSLGALAAMIEAQTNG